MGYAYESKFDHSHSNLDNLDKLPETVTGYRAMLLESIHEAIIATDAHGIVSYWNQLAEQIFSLSAWAALGRPIIQVFRHAMDRNDILDMVHALMRDGCYTGEIDDFPVTGRSLCLGIHARLIPGDARHLDQPERLRHPKHASRLRRAQGVVISIRDMTLHKETERLLLEGKIKAMRMVKKLQLEDQRKDHFLNVISHELRNPLAAIAMGQSLLKHLPPDEETARKTADMMERQTMLLSRLVDDLLDASRIAANKISLKLSAVDLNALVSRIMDDHQIMFAEKGVTLEADLSPEPIMLQADPFRLTQVVGNLLHNAWKFTESGGSVCLATRRALDALIIVKDSGIGIEPDKLDTLFCPFTQVDSSTERKHGGLGLGLSIAKGLVALHGGNMHVESGGIGQGTQFTVHLPAILMDKCVQDAG